MDAETALQVAWIGVLGGLVGGAVVGLIHFVLHRIGSRLRWRDLLRDAAVEFMTNHDGIDSAFFAGSAHLIEERIHATNFSASRLKLLAPKSVIGPGVVLFQLHDKMMDQIRNGQDPTDDEWLEAYEHAYRIAEVELIRELRKVLKTDKHRA